MAKSNNDVDATVYYRRGAECLAKGDAEGAVRHLRRATELTPGYAWAHQNLGQAYRALGKTEAAEQAYRRALTLDPDYVAALVNLGTLLGEGGRYGEAADLLQRAATLAPASPVVRDALAMALREKARDHFTRAAYGEAAEDAARSLAVVEHDVNTMMLLGESLRRSLRFSEAIDVFQRALAQDRDSPRILSNLGGAYFGAGHFREAAETLERAVAIDPKFPASHSNLGVVYQEQGRLDDSIACFRRALALDPSLHTVHSNLLWLLCFKHDVDPAEVFAEHRRFDANYCAALWDRRPHSNPRQRDKRLKIGWVSPDFRRHPGGNFLLPPIECHDRDKFEIYCYSSTINRDDLAARFHDASDHWVEIVGWSAEAIARRVREDGIDILIDCAGHMEGSLLLVFARKPAPVQVSYPLYPNTTGLSAIDYRIMDKYFGPASADQYHSERLTRLADIHVCYEPGDRAIEPPPRLPCLDAGHVLFGSFNNVCKLNDPTLALWGRILRAAPGAKLMLKWAGLDARNPDWMMGRLARAGVPLDCVILAGRSPGVYEPYRQIDICLDPLHANGGTTTCDALWMGVPVVTRPLETPFSRVGLCHNMNLGLPELIAGSDDDYVRIAAELARDTERLGALRCGMRARVAASPVMDGVRYARNLESAFREMWHHWCVTS